MVDGPVRPQSPPPKQGLPASGRIPVAELLADRREVILVHGDEEYRLRLTSNGKLILTK